MNPTLAMPVQAHVLKAIALHAFVDARDWSDALNELAGLSDAEISHLAGVAEVGARSLKRKTTMRLGTDSGCR